METTKIVVLNVNGEIKRFRVEFDFTPDETLNGIGRLWYCFNQDDGWMYVHTSYHNQDDAILAFCKNHWGKRFIAIEAE